MKINWRKYNISDFKLFKNIKRNMNYRVQNNNVTQNKDLITKDGNNRLKATLINIGELFVILLILILVIIALLKLISYL